MKFSGDTQKHASAQLFAWEAFERGVDVHLLAEPTKLEMLQKEYDTKKEQFKSQVQENVLKKYGGEEYLQVPPKSLLLAQTEDYIEYSRSGNVTSGEEQLVIRSRYEEDVYVNNHTSVWGSYWKNNCWSYKCCRSFVKVHTFTFLMQGCKNIYQYVPALIKVNKSNSRHSIISHDVYFSSTKRCLQMISIGIGYTGGPK